MSEKQTANHICVAAQRCAFAILLSLASLALGPGCVTAPPKKISAAEKARAENAVGAELAHQFEAKLRYKTDHDVDHYLTKLAHTLAKPSGDPRLIGSGVVVIQDQVGQWRTYSLPGRRTYLSLGLLQQLHYDNEIAAIIALEFGNIVQSHALNHLRKHETPPRMVDFFGTDGIFSFDLEEMKASIRTAVDILYAAGFDNRGLCQLWSVLKNNPSHSPFPEKVLDELDEFTRATTSRYAPLRNPIVRTEEFKSVEKRILKL